MKQKSEFSVIGRAMATVAGFDRVYRTLEQQVVLRGQAKSTFENYIHRIAQVSLHFNCLPEDVNEEELNEYLAALALSAKSHLPLVRKRGGVRKNKTFIAFETLHHLPLPDIRDRLLGNEGEYETSIALETLNHLPLVRKRG